MRKLKDIQKALIIFLKYPEPGKVKTRLAAGTGEKFALKFYRLCIDNLICEVRIIKDTAIYIFYAGAEEKEFTGWIGGGFNYIRQNGNDLGGKMASAFKSVLEKHKKAIITGSDIPDLNAEIINEAFSKLKTHDFVIGPSSDGGYYLLGMKNFSPFLFNEIKWSTSAVFEDTIVRMKHSGKTFSVLEKIDDIDTKEDLYNWLKRGKNISLINDTNVIISKE